MDPCGPRASAGPFGTTIAHGFLTLPMLARQVYLVRGLAMAVNYGTDKVRFPAPVPGGSRLRAGIELVSLVASGAGSRAVTRVTVELEGSAKPVCVAETVALLVPGTPEEKE